MNVQVRIELEGKTLEGEGKPTPESVNFKNEIAFAIEECGIGTVTGSGVGFGAIDMDVEMTDSRSGVTRLRKLLQVLEIENAVVEVE